MLECPVCLEYPRTRPVYTCNNGHITCSECISKIRGFCPICRNEDIKPNQFVSRMTDTALQGVLISCRFAIHGCLKKSQIDSMQHHEERCSYREVACPGRHRMGPLVCNWHGSLYNMCDHVIENKCMQILGPPNSSDFFKSVIGDFHDPNKTVFERIQDTYWKPIMFVSDAVVKYLIYMTVTRKRTGIWYLQFRSLSPLSEIQRLKVKLQVYKSGERRK